MRQRSAEDDDLSGGREVSVDVVDLILETLVEEFVTEERERVRSGQGQDRESQKRRLWLTSHRGQASMRIEEYRLAKGFNARPEFLFLTFKFLVLKFLLLIISNTLPGVPLTTCCPASSFLISSPILVPPIQA